jgi:hypothetical protein
MRDKSERKETRSRKLLPLQGASDMAARKLRFDFRFSNIFNHFTRYSRMSQDRNRLIGQHFSQVTDSSELSVSIDHYRQGHGSLLVPCLRFIVQELGGEHK